MNSIRTFVAASGLLIAGALAPGAADAGGSHGGHHGHHGPRISFGWSHTPHVYGTPTFYGHPTPWTPAWYAYCRNKYRSFDPRSGTFLGYDGHRHFCR
jgi:hypothetical protein